MEEVEEGHHLVGLTLRLQPLHVLVVVSVGLVQLTLRLFPRGLLTACIDYRNDRKMPLPQLFSVVDFSLPTVTQQS